MEIKFRKYKDIVVLDLIGEFDLYNTTMLLDSIKKIRKKKVNDFIINLANVSYIDSSGIGSLIKIHSKNQSDSGFFCISGISNTILKIFEQSGLNHYFNLENDVKSAIKRCINSKEVSQQ